MDTLREATSGETHIGPVSFELLAESRYSGKRRKRQAAKGASRQQTAAAAETVLLVLAADSPLPETEQDVLDLTVRLRGHIAQLGAVVPTGEPALLRAQRLGATPVPDDYLKSRVHLRHLAESVHELVAVTASRAAVAPAVSRPSQRLWCLNRNMVRAAVFVVALVVLAIAAAHPLT